MNDRDLIQMLLTAIVMLARDQYYNREPVLSDSDYDALGRILGAV